MGALVAVRCGAAVTGNAAVERAFAEHRSGIEVTAEGSVTRLLSDDTGPSGTHQRFIMLLKGSAQTLLIDNNVDIGKRVPLAIRDDVVVHGEYVWNDQGGLIHFTHHDPAHTHEDGWIEARGVRYSSEATSDPIAAVGSVAGSTATRAAVVRLAWCPSAWTI